MSLDRISAQLQQFKKASIASKKEVDDFCHESPLLRTKREVQQELARAEKYRASILKNVTTFGGLTHEALISAAQSMEEVYFVKGDDIIEQDDIGDSFFVLEQGTVVVTRKANTRDAYEKPRELARLSKNAHFGEIALLTAEPRSATVTVVSDTAKCLRMTKAKFDELLATTNKLHAENRRLIGRDVLDQVPLFRSLSAVNKKKLLDSMIPMTYLPSSYICRQSTAGNTFYIITEGHCRVTVNCEDKTEKEVGKLRAGDFFGHVALIEANNRRTANVISVDTVSCLTLSRTDFNRLLANLKVKLLEHQSGRTNNIKGTGDLLQTSSLANKRRISMYNTHGHRDENRISNLFKRFTKFITESLWNTLYSRMYREMLLDPSRQIDYGVVAETVMRENSQRYSAVTALSAEAQRILEMDPPRRSMADHAFVMGLLRQRNDLREKLCKSWPAHQFGVLCKRVKLQKFLPFKKIFEIDSTGTAAYLIVRGCVRLYSKSSTSGAGGGDAHAPKMYFEQDLGPGEVFGEAALGGIHTRMQLAQAICHVDAIVIDDADFMAAQDKDSAHMGTEERQRFLAAVPLFKNWDSYKLLRLAHALIQEEVNKGVVLTHHGKPCKDLYFIVNGRMDVVTSLEKRYIITPLLKHDYIGESSIINKFIKSTANKVCEEYYSVAVTKVEVLILPDAAFTLFDLHSVDVVRSTFMAKAEWRRQRVRAMKFERAKLRKHKHHMGKECAALHEFPVDKQFLSEDQIRLVEDTHGRSTWARLQAEKLSTGAGTGAGAGSGSRPGSPAGRQDDGVVVGEFGAGSPLSRPTSALPDIGATAAHLSATFPGPGPGAGTLLSAIAPTITPARRAGSARRPRSAVATALANPAITGVNAPVQKLSDIEDIPTIFIQDMDRFMVSITCRTDRDRAKFANTVSNALRPKSARAREFAEKTLCENTVISKRADVLAVLEDKDTTRSKLVIRNRRNSAAFTAFALLKPSDTRVRPHTAGQLQGMRPIERPARQALEGLGTRSADSLDSSGARGPGHIATHDILHESRQRAMQSGGVDLLPPSFPEVGSPAPSGKGVTHVVAFADQLAQATRLSEEVGRLPFVAGLRIKTRAPTDGGSATLTAGSTQSNVQSTSGTGTNTGTMDAHADFDDELEHDAIDHEGDPSDARLERENHTPFGSPSTSRRKESVTASVIAAAAAAVTRRASLSLRGSLCIPASSSYVDTLSRSHITPKSAMEIKLEASIDKYIYKKQPTT